MVAAGERWPDDSLRPAAEDLWGAGAVLALLPRDDLSPEARLAADAFLAVEASLADSVHGCASGRELSAADFAEDVAVAAELDVSRRRTGAGGRGVRRQDRKLRIMTRNPVSNTIALTAAGSSTVTRLA